MTSMTRVYERLAAGECVPMREGKRARPTGPAVACPKCKGGGTVVEEQPAAAIFRYLEAHCSECWGTGKHVPFVIEADPMMLKPWVGSVHLRGLIERYTIAGVRVVYVDDSRGDIRVVLTPVGARPFTIDLAASYDDKTGRRKPADRNDDTALTWAVARRLADAELRALGYRET